LRGHVEDLNVDEQVYQLTAHAWRLDGDRMTIAWFDEVRRPPRRALLAAVDRLATLLGQNLQAEVVAA